MIFRCFRSGEKARGQGARQGCDHLRRAEGRRRWFHAPSSLTLTVVGSHQCHSEAAANRIRNESLPHRRPARIGAPRARGNGATVRPPARGGAVRWQAPRRPLPDQTRL